MQQQRIRLTTPPGKFCWPKLNEADYGSADFPVPDGQFVVNLEFNPNDTEGSWSEGSTSHTGGWKSFLERLQEIDDENYTFQCNKLGKDKAKRKSPYKVCQDDQGDDTGLYQLIIKCKATIKTRNGDRSNRPVLFDRMAEPLDKTIGGGSVGKVCFEPFGYYRPNTGAALYHTLQAVQVIDLVEGTGAEGQASAYAFDDMGAADF